MHMTYSKIKLQKRKEHLLLLKINLNILEGMQSFINISTKILNAQRQKNGDSGKIFLEFVLKSNGTIDAESVRTLTADELA